MFWRLLRDGPAEGAFNMAMDEVLYRSAVEEAGPPTLRLYSWSRATLSFGRHQSSAQAGDIAACRRLGVDLVRRMSGGRAVLHHQELTFSLAVPGDQARGLSVRQAYAWVTGLLRSALERAGVPLDPPASTLPRPEPHRALPCFAVAGEHEIASGGRKLVGVAQVWSRRGFLQHGSILRSVDRGLWLAATGVSEVELKAVALDELCIEPPRSETLADLVEQELARSWGAPAAEKCLRAAERERADFLARTKYRSEAWTLEGAVPTVSAPRWRKEGGATRTSFSRLES